MPEAGRGTVGHAVRQFSKALAYPAQPVPLALILLLSLFGALTSRPGVLGATIQIALFMLGLRYAYAVIVDTARDRDTAPRVSWRFLNEGLEQPLKQFGVVILFALAHRLCAGTLGEAAGDALLVLVNFLAPATAMVIAIENSFMRAVNPVHLYLIIRPVAVPYLVLCLLLWSCWSLAQTLFDWLTLDRAPAFNVLMYDLISLYFLLSMAYLTGGLVALYRDRLGL